MRAPETSSSRRAQRVTASNKNGGETRRSVKGAARVAPRPRHEGVGALTAAKGVWASAAEGTGVEAKVRRKRAPVDHAVAPRPPGRTDLT